MAQQWVFEGILWDDSERRGTIRVQRNSGHQSMRINYQTNKVTAGDFIYYATWRGDDGGKPEKFALTREGLEQLRAGALQQAS